MYSLGVILLEMTVPFSTGMERAKILASIQRENHTLPEALDAPNKVIQGNIFMSLVQHKPSLRPSSSELLNSGQIPVQDEDESFRIARLMLADESSHFRSQFISSLFPKAQSSNDAVLVPEIVHKDPMQAINLLEDVSAMSNASLSDLNLQALVKHKMKAIFEVRGGVERIDSPALFPYQLHYPSEDVVQYLQATGKVMQLPYDLILPHAMLLAGKVTSKHRTFIFDNVYRASHLMDQPKIFGEVNYDIISESSASLALHEAEVIKVVDEILDAFPNLSSVQLCYHLNHSRLLDAILCYCEIDKLKWSAVKQTISKLHTSEWTWAKVRHELRGPSMGIAATALDELERFDFRDSWETAVSRLRAILKDTTHLEASFAHMQAVIRYLGLYSVQRRIYINPLSSYNEKFYSGNLLFQCVFDQKRRSVLAAGGRYDELIRDFQPLTLRKNRVHAVGFQLAWTGLCAEMSKYLKKLAKTKSKRRPDHLRFSAWKTRRCDALVDSFDPSLLDDVGIKLVNELCGNNISAELAETYGEEERASPYAKVEERTEDHSWVILIKSEGIVKVRDIARDDEIEIRTSELISHLRSEIRDRDKHEERMPKASLLRHRSHPDTSAIDRERDVDVKILMSQNKGKKVNRKTIIEEAQAHKRAYLQACVDSPIIAIETKDEVFEGINETRLSDPDSWRVFIQSAGPGERQYLGQLQNMLKNVQKEAKSGNPNAIIYNFRSKACISYYLGKSS